MKKTLEEEKAVNTHPFPTSRLPRRLSELRLGTRLTLLILLVVLPILAVGNVLVNARGQAAIAEQANHDLSLTNRTLARNISIWLRLNAQTLNELASRPEIISMEAQVQKPLLERVSAAHPQLFLVQTTDPAGMNVARSDTQENKDYRDRGWYQGAMTGAPLTMEVLISRTTGKPALNMATAIQDAGGRIVGVGSISSELSEISAEVEASQLGETGYAYVVDGMNKVVAHPDPAYSEGELRDLSAYAPVRMLREGRRGLVTFQDEQGEDWHAYVEQIDNGWGVIVQQKDAELLASVYSFAWISWITLVIGAVALLGVVWVVVRQTTRPIVALTKAAEAIWEEMGGKVGSGQWAVGSRTASGDEIRVLGEAFTQMTMRLRETIDTLQQANQRTQAVLEALSDSLMVTDLEGRLLDVNETLLLRFGFAKKADVVGKEAARLAIEADRPRAAAHLVNNEAVGKAVEYTFRAQTGEEFPGELATSMIGDAQGNCIGYVAIVRDITVRKEAEAAIRESESRQRSVLEKLEVSLLISRYPDGKILYVNPAFGAAFGVRADEMIGRQTPDLYYALADRATLLAELRRLGALKNYEVRAKRLDNGEVFWADLSIRFFTYGGENALLVSLLDITESKEAREALRESQKRLSALVETAPVGIIEWTPGFEAASWNPAAAAIFGYTQEEAVGRKAVDLIIPESARLTLIDEVWPALIAQKGGGRNTNQNVTKDGRLITCEWYNTPMLDAEGRVVGVSSLVQDITERVELEREMRRSLETRSRQAQISIQIAQEFATATNQNELFRRVVTMVKERFNYYHAQILRYEPSQNAIVLLAGYGTVGEEMLKRRHQMPMGVGLIGTAAATGQTILRTTLRDDADWRPNPLLPDTQGEIAAPIKLRGQVLGVLDVQSDRAGALTQDDVILLEGLCGQAAVAVEETRLRQEMEERIQELNTLYGALSRPGWESLSDSLSAPGYFYDQTAVVPWKGSGKWEVGSGAAWTASLNLRGSELLSQVAVENDPQRPLSQEEQSFVEQVAEQMGLALESARLFAQTQASLAQTEEQARRLRQLNELAAALNAAEDVKQILTILNNKLLNILDGDRVWIALLDPFGNSFQMYPPPLLRQEPHRTPLQDGGVGERMSVSATAAGMCVRERRLITLPGDGALNDFIDAKQLAEEGLRTIMAAPLIASAGAIGAINLASYMANAYPQTAKDLLGQVAALASSIIESRRLLDEVQARAQRERILREITTRVRASTDANIILRTAVREIGEAFQRSSFIRLGNAEELSSPPNPAAGERKNG